MLEFGVLWQFGLYVQQTFATLQSILGLSPKQSVKIRSVAAARRLEEFGRSHICAMSHEIVSDQARPTLTMSHQPN
jgi:hypothetical protein